MGPWEVESAITTGANTDGTWLRRAAIRVSHRMLHNLITYQMTIWMCRRHDDFRSAAPTVKIAMQLHVTSASEKVGGLSPSPKSGGPISLSPPPAPTPMFSFAASPLYFYSQTVILTKLRFLYIVHWKKIAFPWNYLSSLGACIPTGKRCLRPGMERRIAEMAVLGTAFLSTLTLDNSVHVQRTSAKKTLASHHRFHF